MTPASEHLIKMLAARLERNLAKAEAATKEGKHDRAHIAQGWADATELALADLELALPWIEEDARRAQAMG